MQVLGSGSPRQSCVPKLTALCQAAVQKSVEVHTICSALSIVDLLHPVLDEVAPTLIGFLARNLVQVLRADPKGLETLPAPLMAEVLGNPCLVICHLSFFLKTGSRPADWHSPLAEGCENTQNTYSQERG